MAHFLQKLVGHLASLFKILELSLMGGEGQEALFSLKSTKYFQ